MLQVQTITRTYETFEDARNVAVRLAEVGIQPERIGLLGQQAGGDDNTAAAAGVGGAAGAATGLALGLGALTIPGVGPIIATGWFLSGAVTSALAGGVLGALVDAGVPANDAERHASEHASGRSVVSVRVEESDVALVTRIMDAAMPVEAGDIPLPRLERLCLSRPGVRDNPNPRHQRS
ncbi:hypothetical protein [Bosea thiooxidans]|uniref:hypothetical protein n=1 Tax=Bosea thiooxidans TaxID=53254 RepID=UPI0012E1F0BE|nr:hypothetical protein [Bosea thiooxidans]